MSKMKTVILSFGRRTRFHRNSILYQNPDDKQGDDKDRRYAPDRRSYKFRKGKYRGRERRKWLTDAE
jgi:hypothetical protein